MLLSPSATFVGCAPHRQAVAAAADRVYTAASHNIIGRPSRLGCSAAPAAIFLNGPANCLCSHGDSLLAAGDTAGRIYIIRDDEVVHTTEHSESIQGCAFLDSSRLVYFTNFSLHLWDFLSGAATELATDCLVSAIGVRTEDSAAGARLLAGLQTGSVRVYSADGGRIRHIGQVSAHTDAVTDIKSSPGGRIATCSLDGNIRLWTYEGDSLRLSQILNGHSDWVNALCWTADTLYSVSSDKTLRCWRAPDSGGRMEMVHVHGGCSELIGVCAGADGQTVIQEKAGSLEAVDVEAGGASRLSAGHQGEITDLDWRGPLLLSSSLDRTVRLWYCGVCCGLAQQHGYPIVGAQFVPGTRLRLVSAAQETIVRVYEATRRFLRACRRAEGVYAGAPDGGDDILGCDPRDYVEGATLAELNLTNETEDGTESGTESGTTVLGVFKEEQKIYGPFFESTSVAVNSHTVFFANRSSSREFAGLFVRGLAAPLQAAPKYYKNHDLGIVRIRATERHVITVSRDKTACLYSIEEGGDLVLMRQFSDHSRVVWDCGFSRDESLFATCSRDRRVILYSVGALEPVASREFEAEVTALHFSPAADILAVGLQSGLIHIFDYAPPASSAGLAEGVFSRRASGRVNGRVSVLRFNGDGTELAAGGADWAVRIFKIAR